MTKGLILELLATLLKMIAAAVWGFLFAYTLITLASCR
jgi:hypothetical protein